MRVQLIMKLIAKSENFNTDLSPTLRFTYSRAISILIKIMMQYARDNTLIMKKSRDIKLSMGK